MPQVPVDLESEEIQRELATFPVLEAKLKGDVTTRALKAFVMVAPGESMLHVAYRRWRRALDETWFDVCARWRSFLAFITDLGLPASAAATLMRANPLEPIRPGNAAWLEVSHAEKLDHARAVQLERRRCHRVSPDDPPMTLNELADRYGVRRDRVNQRRFEKKAGGYTPRQVFGLDPLPSKDPKNPPRAPRLPRRERKFKLDWIKQRAVEF